MNILQKLKNRFYSKLSNWVRKQNIILLNKDGVISKKALISGSKLYGRIKLSEGVRIDSSFLSGNVEIKEGAVIRKGVYLNSKSRISIERYTVINGPNTTLISDINQIEVGAFCSIARNVQFQEANHDYHNFTTSFIESKFGQKKVQEIISKGGIKLGHDVWIGTQCVILSGAEIGTGAIVAANSVVSGVIPPYAIVAGSPAKVLKYRFDEIKIKELLESQWWYHINKENYKEFKIKFNSI